MNPNEQAQQPQSDSTKREATPRAKMSTLLESIADAGVRQDYARELVRIEVDRQKLGYDRTLAEIFADSGEFDGIKGKTPEQAVSSAMARIQVGKFWGINPADSMRFIRFDRGKPVLENEIIAAKLQESGWEWDLEYDRDARGICIGCHLYPKKLNRETGKHDPLLDRAGNPVVISFTKTEADNAFIWEKDKQIRLSDKWNFKSWPEDMYFWRCISRFKRRHATGVLVGARTMDEAQEQYEPPTPEAKPANPYMTNMPTGEQDHHEPSSTAAAQGVGGSAESPNSPPAVESAAAQPAAEVGRNTAPASTGGSGNPTSPAAPQTDNPSRQQQASGEGGGHKTAAAAEPVASTAGPASTATGTTSPSAPESEDDTASDKNKSTFQKMLDAFAEQKKRLGEPLYYKILGANGVEKSNQFTSMAEARKVYGILHNTEPQAAPERKAADPNNPVERVKAALEELTGLYDKKSPDAVKKAVDGFMKGFYGPTKPKPDAANVEGILSVVRLARAILVQYPQQIVESAAKAQATGNTVGVGYRESLKYLEGRSPAVHAAFWRCAEALWCESGGQDGIEYLEGVLGAKTLADEDLAALLIITLRRPQTPAKALLNQSKVTSLPVAKIVAGWGIDIEKAPVEGINAFLKAAAAAKAEVVEPEPAAAEVNPPAEAVEEDDSSWLTGVGEDN